MAAPPLSAPEPVLVTCSPRLPGQLTWPAWQALHRGPVLSARHDSVHLPHLAAAGVDVELVPALPALEQAAALAGSAAVWFDADPDLVDALTGRARVVTGSFDPPGSRLLDVVALMDRLRSPGGCPWDAQQSHTSLMRYLLEEAYEAYQALEDGDLDALREELGDVLLQVVFHARLAQEHAGWSIDEVAGDLVDKLVRRHPHVFAGGSAQDLQGSWDALKAAEKGRTSVTDGVPLGQPALSLAATLQRRAARLGAPVTLPVATRGGLGARLWGLVEQCGEQGLDPEAELRSVARGYRDRLAAAEARLRADGTDPKGLDARDWAVLVDEPA